MRDPSRALRARRKRPREAGREEPTPVAAQVFEAKAPVSDLDPVPYADGGDGPAEATFADDLPQPAPLPLAPEAAPAYDDLKRVSGIGPSIESQLAEIGVTTYRQIALFTDDDIERVGRAHRLFR